MEKQRALTVLVLFLETIYCIMPSLIGSNFRKSFVDYFKDFYGDLSHKDYLKSVSRIINFRLRNKLIGILDLMNNETPTTLNQNSIIRFEELVLHLNWIVLHVNKELNTKVLLIFFEKIKNIMTPKEFQIFITLLNYLSFASLTC